MLRALLFLKYIFSNYKRILIFNVSLLLLVGVLEAMSIFGIAPVIDVLLQSENSSTSKITSQVNKLLYAFGVEPSISLYVSFFMSMICLKAVLLLYCRIYANRSKYYVVGSEQDDLIENVLKSNWGYIRREKKGQIVNTVMKEINNIGDGFSSLNTLITSFVRLLFYLLVPLYISWKLTLISVILGCLVFLPIRFFSSFSYSYGKESTETANNFSVILQEILSGLKTVMSFGNPGRTVQLLQDAHKKHRNAVVKLLTFTESVPILYEPLIMVILIVIVVVSREYSLATVSEILIVGYSLRVALPLSASIVSEISNISRFYPGVEQIKKISMGAKDNRQISGELDFEKVFQKVEFQNVKFFYRNEKDKFMLKDINIVIKSGDSVTFTGRSGCGKSTLLDLLMCFDYPDSGEILIDSKNIHSFNIEAFREKIGYVPQENVFFNMSVRDNLTWPYEKVSDLEIMKVLEQTNCTEFVFDSGRSLDSLMGEDGSNFSGGQRQRLAIARALLGKPEILILDEITSNLDVVNETKIQAVLDTLKSHLTIVSVAHRTSAMINSDKIYYFEDGRLVEQGSYEELIRLKGNFFQSYILGEEMNVN